MNKFRDKIIILNFLICENLHVIKKTLLIKLLTSAHITFVKNLNLKILFWK